MHGLSEHGRWAAGPERQANIVQNSEVLLAEAWRRAPSRPRVLKNDADHGLEAYCH